MNKLDKITLILNIVLSVLYVPFSIFCFLLQMASEGGIDVTDTLYIRLMDIFCFVSAIIPLLCIAGIILSVVLRKRGHSILSFSIQFLPIIVFVFNLILSMYAESLLHNV